MGTFYIDFGYQEPDKVYVLQRIAEQLPTQLNVVSRKPRVQAGQYWIVYGDDPSDAEVVNHCQKIGERVWKAQRTFWSLSPEEMQTTLEDWFGLEHKPVDDAKRIVDLIVNQHKKAHTEMANRVQTQDKTINDLSAKLTEVIRERQDTADKLEKFLTQNLADKEAAAQKELDEISRIPVVQAIKFQAGQLAISTGKIIAHAKSGLYDLGEFNILINLQYSNVTVHRKDGKQYKDTGYYAPHVTRDGSVCWGSMKLVLAQLFGAGELSSIVGMTVHALEYPNEADSAGRIVTQWPKYVPEILTEVKTEEADNATA